MAETKSAFHAASSDCLERSIGCRPNRSSRSLGWDNCEMAYWDVLPESHEYESGEDVLLALHLDPKVNIELRINGQSCNYRTAPGLITLVAPGSEISFRPDAAFRFYMLHLPSNGIALDRLAARNDEADKLLQFSHDNNLRQMMSIMLSELMSPSRSCPQFVHSLSDTITLYLRDRLQRGVPVRSQPPCASQMMLEVDKLISEEIGAGSTVKDIAEAAGLSKNRFSALVKSMTGLPPHKYIVEKRISMAELLLRNSFLPLSEIALQTGFANQSHFTESFHKSRGVTPLRYRKFGE